MTLAMARNHAADESVLEFRERSFRDGEWVSYVVIAIVSAYALATWERPHRDVILVLAGLGVVATAVVSLLPWARIIRSRWCEPYFLAWSGADIALVAGMVAADGGVGSPLSTVFFLPLIIAGLSYPKLSVALVGVQTLAGFLIASWAAGDFELVSSLPIAGFLVAAAVMCFSQAANRERLRSELAILSRSDFLTGCLNRRGFTERFAAALSDVNRHPERTVGLVVLDLDHFKVVNDTQGHQAGDQVLCRVADALQDCLRPSDALARLGGDEFAVLLPEVAPDEVPAIAERMQERLASLAPVSAGVARLPDDGETQEELHHAADGDLYRAKRERPAGPVASRSSGRSYAPSARAMTICWTSSVPSPMVRILASR
jgi:diguanylate cyclase (GGDEF)-like protein